MTSISIMRCDSVHGEKLKCLLQGKTYMNFDVHVCPAYGEFEVWIHTNSDYTETELTQMVIAVLAWDLVKAQEVVEYYRENI